VFGRSIEWRVEDKLKVTDIDCGLPGVDIRGIRDWLPDSVHEGQAA